MKNLLSSFPNQCPLCQGKWTLHQGYAKTYSCPNYDKCQLLFRGLLQNKNDKFRLIKRFNDDLNNQILWTFINQTQLVEEESVVSLDYFSHQFKIRDLDLDITIVRLNKLISFS